jgi:hypothetical protein
MECQQNLNFCSDLNTACNLLKVKFSLTTKPDIINIISRRPLTFVFLNYVPKLVANRLINGHCNKDAKNFERNDSQFRSFTVNKKNQFGPRLFLPASFRT